MSQAAESLTASPPLPARPLPVVCRAGAGFVPAIYHPERATEYLRFERFPRKTKLTAEAALEYAAKALWYRRRKETEMRRRFEATVSPHWLGRAA